MAHDLAAFEGDWWLLVEEEGLDRTPEQRWTLRAGRVWHQGADVGACHLDGEYFVIAAEGQHMRFLPDPTLPTAYLMGNILDERVPAYCTFIRAGDDEVS